MTLKHRIAKIEDKLTPPEKLWITCVLRGPDDPEPDEDDYDFVIKVTLDSDEE